MIGEEKSAVRLGELDLRTGYLRPGSTHEAMHSEHDFVLFLFGGP